MAAIDREAHRAASQWGLDADDLRQEFYLWLAAPTKSGDSRWRGLSVGFVVNKLRTVIQREHGKEARRDAHETELDESTV